MKYLVIILFALLIAGGGTGYWYYQDSQERMSTLRENNANLKTAVDTSLATISSMSEQEKINQERISNLDINLKNAQQYNSELRKMLQEHNLTILAEEKPKLIEKRINDATREVFTSIMRDTNSR